MAVSTSTFRNQSILQTLASGDGLAVLPIRRNQFRRILRKYIVGVNAVVLWEKNRTPYLQLHF